ncbi:inorganic pyrophosphatase [Colletotrichum tofieldiae]|uniref:Inorganic pyrophosphatase n=1 Tax=Colletotrichum tofieldiae TaxID=708197 RepID=A0A166Y7G3_9PEZI|nr:inorganic pyrophosphatase [Colletotrichum tofieldiae]
MRQNAREARWVARTGVNEPPSPATLNSLHMARGGIEKKSSKKWKSRATDSKLSIELDRLLVGDDASVASTQQSHAIYRIQHPLRAVLHSLPGFTYDTELDNVTFRKHKRVLFGIEGLMEEGGRDAAKEWLEGFLLLTFETIGRVLGSYPLCRELDDIPNGFVIMAREVEAAISRLPSQSAIRARRAMERRLCQSYDLRKLVDWTIRARQRFLESKPKIMPGFGAFGQVMIEKGTDLEERLWAAVDIREKE